MFSRSQIGTGLAVALVAFAGLTFTSGQFVPPPGPSGGGGAGSGLFRQTMSAIPTSANTGLNAWMAQPASATVNDDANGIVVFDPSGASTVKNALRVRAAPATPYKIKALVSLMAAQGTNASAVFGFADGTAASNKEQVFLFKPFNTGGTEGLAVSNFTNSTTFSANVVAWVPQMISPFIWLRISDDGTTAKYEVSTTGDDDMWISIINVTKSGSFLGASGFTNIIFGSSGFNGDARGELLSWTVQ